MTSCVSAISISEEPAAISVRPANWPALVTFVMLMSTALAVGSPAAAAAMPNVTDTERYPRPMGTPSRKPAASESFTWTFKKDQPPLHQIGAMRAKRIEKRRGKTPRRAHRARHFMYSPARRYAPS